MLGSFGNKGQDAMPVQANVQRPQRPANSDMSAAAPAQRTATAATTTMPMDLANGADEAAPAPNAVSSIGAGMSIVGNVTCDSPVHLFGRLEGEIRASQLLVGDGAEVDGNILAQELVVRGTVRGTIRALRVQLKGNGAIEGDVYHKFLSIEENASFEGTSRRAENPMAVEKPTASAAAPAQAASTRPSAPAPRFAPVASESPTRVEDNEPADSAQVFNLSSAIGTGS